MQSNVQDLVEANKDNMGLPSQGMLEHMEETEILQDINKTIQWDLDVNKAERSDEDEMSEHNAIVQDWMDKYFWGKDDMIDDINDPEFLVETVYDETLIGMKEQLLRALRERKRDVLDITFKLFCKIQNKKFNLKQLDSIPKVELENDYIDDVQSNLSKVKLLVDDNRSPLLSLLIDTEKYHEASPLYIHEQYPTDSHYEKTVDFDRCVYDSERLKSADDKINDVYKALMAMKVKIFYEKCDLESKGFKKANNMASRFESEQENYIKELYNEYLDGQNQTNLPDS